jgi:glycosyltransferase involved in cell wall biosynthesis
MAFDLAEAMRDMVEIDFFFFDQEEGAREVPGATELFFATQNTFEGYDIVHAHGFKADAYIWYHSKAIKAMKVNTLHDYVEEDLTYQYNRLISAIFWRVWKVLSAEQNEIVALSKHMRKYYQKLWSLENIQVIPNTRLLDPATQANSAITEQILAFKKAGHTLMVSVAYATERKGLDQIIRLLPLNTELLFVHIGDGKELNALKSLANKFQVADRCLFIQTQQDAHVYLPLADVFVLPSRSEGFPSALLEAAQMKVPAVVSDIPIMKECFSKEEVFFFDLENITSLSKAVDAVKKKGVEYAERAHARFEQDYAAQVIAEKYFALYSRLLEKA